MPSSRVRCVDPPTSRCRPPSSTFDGNGSSFVSAVISDRASGHDRDQGVDEFGDRRTAAADVERQRLGRLRPAGADERARHVLAEMEQVVAAVRDVERHAGDGRQDRHRRTRGHALVAPRAVDDEWPQPDRGQVVRRGVDLARPLVGLLEDAVDRRRRRERRVVADEAVGVHHGGPKTAAELA